MQKDQHSRKSGAVFTSLEKGRALLALLDYSDRTGKKWSAICSEIMRLVGRSATLEAPLLTRQDLEAWASGRSQLGDEKFSLVFKFLIHPKTLERKEFSKAKSVLVEEQLSAYTGVLNELVGSGSLQPVHVEKGIVDVDAHLAPEDFEGLFVLRRDSRYSLLYLSFESSLNAYLCHMFSSPSGYAEEWVGRVEKAKLRAEFEPKSLDQTLEFDPREFLTKMDWSISRYSGIGVFGNPIRVFLRGLERKDPKEFTIHASLHRSKYSFSLSSGTRCWWVDQSVSRKVAEHIAKSDEAHNGYLGLSMIDTSEFVCGMRWLSSDDIQDMFEDIRWNVGL